MEVSLKHPDLSSLSHYGAIKLAPGDDVTPVAPNHLMVNVIMISKVF